MFARHSNFGYLCLACSKIFKRMDQRYGSCTDRDKTLVNVDTKGWTAKDKEVYAVLQKDIKNKIYRIRRPVDLPSINYRRFGRRLSPDRRRGHSSAMRSRSPTQRLHGKISRCRSRSRQSTPKRARGRTTAVKPVATSASPLAETAESTKRSPPAQSTSCAPVASPTTPVLPSSWVSSPSVPVSACTIAKPCVPVSSPTAKPCVPVSSPTAKLCVPVSSPTAKPCEPVSSPAA